MFKVEEDGNVGVGSTAPSYRLHISSGAGEAGDIVVISTGGSNVIRMTGAGEIYANKYYGDGSDLSGVSGSDDTKVLKAGDTMTGQLTLSGSTLTVIAHGDALASSLWISSSVITPHLYISTNGKVGIGTAWPSEKLVVSGGNLAVYNDGLNPKLILGDSGAAYGQLSWNSDNDYFMIGDADGLKINGNNISIGNAWPGNPLTIVSGGSQMFQVDTAGDIGVGPNAPLAKFDVRAYEAAKNTMYVSTSTTAGYYSIAVSSEGITNINNLVIENRTSDPASPVTGQIWLIVD